MKNISKMFLAALVFAGVASCEDEQDLKFVNPPASFQILTPQNGDAVVLNSTTPNNPALTLAWEDVDYGTPTEVTYTVQVAKNGVENAWATPIDVTTTSNNYASIDMVTLNSAAEDAGLTADVEEGLDIRIKATVAGQEETYSNVITYLVTPYTAVLPVQNLYLVGAATEHGWNNNASNAPLFRDADNQNIYHYTGYFNADGFKVLSARGNWHPQYGSVAPGELGVSGTDGSNEPGQIMVPAAGYYEFTINTADMTYTLTPYDASTSPTFSSVGIIGDATPAGWGSDTDMTNSAFNPHLWRLSSVELTEAKVKFRANDSWDLPGNWGGGTPIQGVTTVNGGDFQGVLDAGNYEVWFNDLDGRYIFIAQ